MARAVTPTPRWVPAPSAGVVVSGLLRFGGLAIVLGVYPMLGAAAIVDFFVVVTPVMHDFWTVDDPERRQPEMTNFLKNAALLGGATLILTIGGSNWVYALNVRT